jgi:hypothetical protein
MIMTESTMPAGSMPGPLKVVLNIGIQPNFICSHWQVGLMRGMMK